MELLKFINTLSMIANNGKEDYTIAIDYGYNVGWFSSQEIDEQIIINIDDEQKLITLH